MIKKQLLLIFLLSLFSETGLTKNKNAENFGNKFINAVGGKEIWAKAKTVHNKAVNHHPAARLPYIQEQWYNQIEPAHVTKINNHDMQRMRSYTVKGGWSKTEKSLTDFSQERLKNEIQSWHRSLYHKLHLIATDSSKLKLDIEDGYLDFYEDNDYIGWVKLSDDGSLLQAGAKKDRKRFTQFAEMIEFGELRWPRSGQNSDGWRFEILSFNLLESKMPIDQSMPVIQ